MSIIWGRCGYGSVLTPFFDDADASFNFPNVLPGSRKVECGVVKVGADLLELIVHEDRLNRETGAVVYLNNSL